MSTAITRARSTSVSAVAVAGVPNHSAAAAASTCTIRIITRLRATRSVWQVRWAPGTLAGHAAAGAFHEIEGIAEGGLRVEGRRVDDDRVRRRAQRRDGAARVALVAAADVGE